MRTESRSFSAHDCSARERCHAACRANIIRRSCLIELLLEPEPFPVLHHPIQEFCDFIHNECTTSASRKCRKAGDQKVCILTKGVPQGWRPFSSRSTLFLRVCRILSQRSGCLSWGNNRCQPVIHRLAPEVQPRPSGVARATPARPFPEGASFHKPGESRPSGKRPRRPTTQPGDSITDALAEGCPP